jgi:hypothetical protein
MVLVSNLDDRVAPENQLWHRFFEAVEFSRIPRIRVVRRKRAFTFSRERIGTGSEKIAHAHIGTRKIRCRIVGRETFNLAKHLRVNK